MPPSPWPELAAAEQAELLALARASIRRGLECGEPLPPPPGIGADHMLARRAAVFITLTTDGALRGCIGSLDAQLPLAEAVANSAFNAAFRDRRFKPLEADELERIRIEISVLSRLEPVSAASRQELLEQLRPGIDGLLLEDRGRRATFLPKVWDKIPSPDDFLDQLLHKAGLGADHWSRGMRLCRYRTLSFAEGDDNPHRSG